MKPGGVSSAYRERARLCHVSIVAPVGHGPTMPSNNSATWSWSGSVGLDKGNSFFRSCRRAIALYISSGATITMFLASTKSWEMGSVCLASLDLDASSMFTMRFVNDLMALSYASCCPLITVLRLR